MTRERPIDVMPVVVADPGAWAFDDFGTPILQWQDQYPVGGALHDGWVLFTHDGDDHFVGGELDDATWAVAQARSWLARFGNHG